jgi:hypothetical protein
MHSPGKMSDMIFAGSLRMPGESVKISLEMKRARYVKKVSVKCLNFMLATPQMHTYQALITQKHTGER